MSKEDEAIIKELESQNIDGMTPNCKSAIKNLADQERGAEIFLFLSMHARIRDLEQALAGNLHTNEEHH